MKTTCGKKAYLNEIEARRSLLRCWEKGRDEKRYYRCPECGFWHLSSQLRSGRQARGRQLRTAA